VLQGDAENGEDKRGVEITASPDPEVSWRGLALVEMKNFKPCCTSRRYKGGGADKAVPILLSKGYFRSCREGLPVLNYPLFLQKIVYP